MFRYTGTDRNGRVRTFEGDSIESVMEQVDNQLSGELYDAELIEIDGYSEKTMFSGNAREKSREKVGWWE